MVVSKYVTVNITATVYRLLFVTQSVASRVSLFAYDTPLIRPFNYASIIGSGQPLPKTNSKLVLWIAQLTSSRQLRQQRSQSITVYTVPQRRIEHPTICGMLIILRSGRITVSAQQWTMLLAQCACCYTGWPKNWCPKFELPALKILTN